MYPLCLIKLLAIAPTIIILSNFEIKFFIILILVEILDPPIMQVTGLVMLDVIFSNALISKSNCNPEKMVKILKFHKQMRVLYVNMKKHHLHKYHLNSPNVLQN